jgi:hypothetical protein
MNWQQVLASSAVTTVALSTIGFLSKEWLAARLKESVADEYKRQLELFKDSLQWETRRREQAAKVAEVFSLWMAANYKSSSNVNDLRYELQQKYWELSLWLDATILRQVNAVLTSADAPGLRHKAALVAIRKLIVGEQDDVEPGELAHWDAISPVPAGRKDE